MQTTKHAVWGVILAVVLTMFVPVLSIAGSLDPSVAPAPTMKTLDDVTPIWSQTLSCNSAQDCQRFKIVNGNAVLDRETGLIWAKSPINSDRVWTAAISNCQAAIIGFREGWRLPTIEELMSLADPYSLSNELTLSNGNPFVDASSSYYWSASTDAADSTRALGFSFGSGPGRVISFPKTENHYTWCVRGGHGL